MGIQGLLPFLANSTRDAHISEFENQYVAVDAYCWLHKGIYSCSYELAMKKPTSKYVTYCLRYIEMLKHFKVKPILVFDGRNLSSKEETEKKRREERRKKYKKGLELLRAGKTSEGRQLLGESVDVGHELVVNLMRECRKLNVDCIVAPFEADAQLSYLSLQKVVACVISEDSDLLVYGCEKVMFKMDKSGRGKLIEKSNIHMSLGMEPEEFTDDKFRYMCILSGCDYLPSLPSIGPANALKFVKLLKDRDIIEILPKLPIYLNKTKITVNPDYIAGFKIADNTFKYQLVYDPFQRKQVPLNPVQNEDDIVGKKLPDNQAFQMAIGNIDPISMKNMDNFDPDILKQGFDILWRTDLPKRLLKENLINFSQPQNGKRQSEAILFNPETKRYCTSSSNNSKPNNVLRRHTISNVPLSGFLFKTDEKITASENDSSFLKSRYFGSLKKAFNQAVENNETEKDGYRKKNESYEEYLRRIYEEQSLANESEIVDNVRKPLIGDDESPESVICNKVAGKSKNSLIVANENSMPIDEGVKNAILKNHSLLDEMSKAEKKNSSPDNTLFSPLNNVCNKSLQVDKNFTLEVCSSIKELPDIQSLCVNSPIQSLLVNNVEVDYEKQTPGENIKRKDEEPETEIPDDPQRSTSPVFKIFKRNKSSSKNFKLENFSNSTETMTSLYFSPTYNNSSVSVKNSVSSKKLGLTKSSIKENKNNCKTPSSACTLFQFGFKKENKEVIKAT